jgi:anthranilate phosphoribosyltransferase
VAHSLPLVVDTCGTGGDGAHTLNLSTGAALVVAALGVPVAKHGNRSVSSRCGSADVLEAMGVALQVPATSQTAVLDECGIAFLMAPAHHPALKHAARVRKELGVRTLFNGLGPLANPAGATHQVLGVYDDSYRQTAAQVLRELGSTRAWVVHSEDGMDELSPSAPTRITELRNGLLSEMSLAPEDFGLERLPRQAYDGGDAPHNAKALLQILSGATHPATDAVVLAAAAALVVAQDLSPKDAAARARQCLASGQAMRAFERFAACTQSIVAGPRP